MESKHALFKPSLSFACQKIIVVSTSASNLRRKSTSECTYPNEPTQSGSFTYHGRNRSHSVCTPEEILAIQNEACRHRKEGLKNASAKHSFQGSPAMSWRKSSAKSFRDSVESVEGRSERKLRCPDILDEFFRVGRKPKRGKSWKRSCVAGSGPARQRLERLRPVELGATSLQFHVS